VGGQSACPILIDGLKRLEYRGYDSAGIAIVNEGRIDVRKCVGKLRALEEILSTGPLSGITGVGHTRWATHGRPSDENAHPHSDCTGRITVVHNGIIENYLALKEDLIAQGHTFRSETDTEVVAHLIEKFHDDDLPSAVRQAVSLLEGSFALAVICRDVPHFIVAARRHSPLVLGVGQGENFLASDVPAFLPYTRKVHFLDDDTLALVGRDSVTFSALDGRPVEKELFEVTWDAGMAERGGYDHFMLKEIFEQPQALRETMRGRLAHEIREIKMPGLALTEKDIQNTKRIIMIACGTAYHAALAGKYTIESLCKIPVEIDVASEFRYRDPIVDQETLGIVISQSGETADTLAGMRRAKELGAKLVAITNVVGSSVARESESVLYTQAGPEIAVASTKAYTTQLLLLQLLALHIARVKETIASDRAEELQAALWELPQAADLALSDNTEVVDCADQYHDYAGFLYMGRGPNLASALEGALKIKEIAYIHAEGYAAGEMKHGPIAMIDPSIVTIALALKGRTYDKILSNIKEVKARDGAVIAIAFQHDDAIASYADRVIRLPETEELLSPILAAIPLQLLAYYTALRRGHDIDQPRNLAKSVTVE
jgi:glutamine---fructose-6-phosphate transaminase (isomerizing)